jgi:hypothetical protein
MSLNEENKKMQSVLRGPDGEYLLKWIDKMSGYKYGLFDPDPYVNAYNCGLRQVSAELHKILENEKGQ